MDLEFAAQIIHGFTSGVKLEKMDHESVEYRRAKKLEAHFTHGVGSIQLLPSPIFPGFSRYLWDVFHYRYVVAAVGPPVTSVTFAVLNHQALVLLPTNWMGMIKQDPLMQIGAIIFSGSQAIDHYNGLFAPGVITREGQQTIIRRAKNYEAEYLRLLKLAKLNDYQEGVLKEFPVFDTSLLYERKPVNPPS